MVPRLCQKGFRRSEPDLGVGTGMGLYLVQQLLMQRAGTLTIESREGLGTTVTIRVRCLQGDASAFTAE